MKSNQEILDHLQKLYEELHEISLSSRGYHRFDRMEAEDDMRLIEQIIDFIKEE